MDHPSEAADILLADDDPVSRHFLAATLEKFGHVSIAVCDGLQAWHALEAEGGPRLAILDWMMPGLDGLQVCAKVRDYSPTRSTYVILLTARDSREDLLRGLQSGADDYIAKPFDPRELCARVEVGLRVLRLQRALADRVREQEEALARVKQLQGLLPICSYCKKIRDDSNYWQQVESYISKHSEAQFSHGICPDCFERFVIPDLDKCQSKVEKEQ
jgi:phosphoserine phosphatase RsbU/P